MFKKLPVMVDFKKAQFLLGAASLSQLPKDTGIEVAFAGRSNAGKSSALNALTHQKTLARVSKTPGRTQQINVFTLDDTRRLIDLPGYGYAKVSHSIKIKWQKTLNAYLQERKSLRGLVLLMDSRHPLKETDQAMVEWCLSCELSCHVLLTKADKLNQKERDFARNTLKKAYGEQLSFQLFSALKKTGLEELEGVLQRWYGQDES